MSVVFLDCDDFKQVNDTHGHDAGDAYLHHVARELNAAMRASDCAFRFAGDEFVLVLPGQHEGEARRMGERLRSRLAAAPLIYGGSTVPVMLSLGAACNREDGVMDAAGLLVPEPVLAFAVEPFAGANLEPSALAFTGIDPADPGRQAVAEAEALQQLFQHVRRRVREEGCKRAILVGHNAVFDLNFLQAAVARCNNKRDPFHPFSCFDTVSLAGLACGQTVLARACEAMGIPFANDEAHSAAYDAQRTAELFCAIVNKWRDLGGWPPG